MIVHEIEIGLCCKSASDVSGCELFLSKAEFFFPITLSVVLVKRKGIFNVPTRRDEAPGDQKKDERKHFEFDDLSPVPVINKR